MDVSVAALTVASTRALIDSGSIVVVVGVFAAKNVVPGAVGEGVGVLVTLFLILACGEG